MKRIILMCCVVMLISTVFASIAVIPNAKDSKYPNKCYYEGPPKLIMELGTQKRISGANCGAYTCRDDYSILIEFCGSVGTNEHCKRVPGNPSSPFPRCCDEYAC